MNPSVGDIVVTHTGQKWRVIHVARHFVRAEHVETGVVSHLDLDAVTVLEPHPGGHQ